MSILELRHEESSSESQLRCQVAMLVRRVEELERKQEASAKRELQMRRKIQSLEQSRSVKGINVDLKKRIDKYLLAEGKYTDGGWVPFAAIRGKFGLKPSRWSQIKRALLEAYPEEYEEMDRDNSGKVFRLVV